MLIERLFEGIFSVNRDYNVVRSALCKFVWQIYERLRCFVGKRKACAVELVIVLNEVSIVVVDEVSGLLELFSVVNCE